MRIRLFGCPVELLGREELLLRIRAAVTGAMRVRVEGLNVAKLVSAHSEPRLMEALDDAELVHIDGAGITLGLRLMGVKDAVRHAGIDLIMDISREAALAGRGIYLLGARDEVVRATAAQMQRLIPGLKIVGVRDGYFGQEEESSVANAIQASGAAVLFIGMTSPKKEIFLHKHWDQLGVTLAMGVGGSFDVLSGRIRRAPRCMQRCGLEWLFRLIQEPRRLFSRYARTNMTFLAWLINAKLSNAGRRNAVIRIESLRCEPGANV